MKRKVIVKPDNERCEWNTYFYGEGRRCVRKSVNGKCCSQHAKMRDAFNCPCCGHGSDELPPEHTQDCSIAYPQEPSNGPA